MRKPRWLLVAAVGMVAGFAAIGSASPAPAAEGATTATVSMVDNEPDLTNWHFDPAEVTVSAGSTVVWVNRGKEEHTVTSDPGSREKFDSGYKKRGASWQRVFSRPGRFSYYCAPHPWMKGTVVVLAAATPPAPTSAPARGADSVSSTTSASVPATTTSTFPPSLATPTTTAPAETATAAAPDTTSTSRAGEGSEEQSAAPASSEKGSGGNLAGTLAVVLLPTLGGLALGARLRRSTPA